MSCIAVFFLTGVFYFNKLNTNEQSNGFISVTTSYLDSSLRSIKHAQEIRDNADELRSQIGAVSPNHPAPSEHLWIEINNKRTLIRRTAYYDSRSAFGPAVVIISLHNERDEPVKPTLHLKIFFPDGAEFCMSLSYWRQIGKYKPVLKDYYAANLLRVELPKDASAQPPLSVAVSRDEHCTDLMPYMPVFSGASRKGSEPVFSVCTGKALYGEIDPQWIVHWIELNRALGASYITILIQNVTENLYKVLLPYVEEGIVEMIDWRISIFDIHEKGMWASLQECIYRNVNRAQYLALHDSDEILVPQKHLTWIEMLKDLEQIADISKYASLVFPNAYWFDIGLPLLSAEEALCTGMNLPEYFKRTDRSMNPEYLHPKLMLCLDYVIASDIHEASDWIEDKEQYLRVPANIGQSFHYRSPIREEDYRLHNRTYDPNFMKRYVDIVMPRIKDKLCSGLQNML